MTKKQKKVLKITVGGIPWKVKFLTSKQMLKVYKETQLLGLTDPMKQEIYVDYERTQSTVISTLFHELFHASVSSLQGSKESFTDAVNEEAAANCVGNCMLEFLEYIQDAIFMIVDLSPEEDDE